MPAPRTRLWLGLAALVTSACAGTQAAQRALRIAARTVPDATGRIVIYGGQLRDLDGQRVTVADFALDVTEVTVADYRRCHAAGVCTLDPARSSRGCNFARLAVDAHPVNCVSIAEAEAYCRWRGARLPTADEWQWAAQGRERAWRYVWGPRPRRRTYRVLLVDFDPFVCGRPQFDTPPRTTTCTVGRHDRSRDGVADLGGNLSEWVRVTANDVQAVGASFDYPLVNTRVSVGRRRWRHREAADAVLPTLRDDRQSVRRDPDSRIGFRCAFTLAESP